MSKRQIHRNHLRLVTDDEQPKPRWLARALNGLVAIACASVSADLPEHQREWAYDLRRNRLSLCGGLFRFIDLLHRKGFPIETALLIPEWITAYIYDRYRMTPPSTPAIAIHLMKTGEHERAQNERAA